MDYDCDNDFHRFNKIMIITIVNIIFVQNKLTWCERNGFRYICMDF